jgi:hypothetical protein
MEYSIFSVTNQVSLLHFFLICKVLAVFGNYIVHSGLLMRFIYCVVMNALAGLVGFTGNIIVLMRLINLNKVCDLLTKYYDKILLEENKDNSNVKSLNMCKNQKGLYITWIGIELVMIVLKFISIYLGYRAHLIVKKQDKSKRGAKK